MVITKVLPQVDTLLFKLLVLRRISDRIGRVWRCLHSQLYLVEITLENSASVSNHLKILQVYAHVYSWCIHVRMYVCTYVCCIFG